MKREYVSPPLHHRLTGTEGGEVGEGRVLLIRNFLLTWVGSHSMVDVLYVR